MKILGIGICFAIILGAFFHTGPHLYLDINSAIFVLGGATGFMVMKNKPENHLQNFGKGAVYFGWLGLLIAWISIASNGFNALNAAELGVSTAYSLHPLLYGYVVKFISLSLDE